MPQWVRDASQCSASNDGSIRTAQEGYVISGGADPIAVSTKPESFVGGDDGTTPLPKHGTLHPSDRTLFLDRYDVRTDGGNTFATALYSSDRRFQVVSFPNAPAKGYRWRAGTQIDVYDLPYAQAAFDTFWKPINPFTSERVDKKRWVFKTEPVKTYGQQLGMSLRIKDEKLNAAMQTFFELQGRAMAINGKVWVFEGGDVDENGSEEDYRLQLRFLREMDVELGVDEVWNDAAPGDDTSEIVQLWPRLESTYPGSGSIEYNKPAYHGVVILPRSGDPSFPPIFKAIPQFEFAENGFERLARLIP